MPFLKASTPVMSIEPSHATDEFSEYETLATRYRACVIQCQASLDQLEAAERELRAAATEQDCDFDSSAHSEIERALRHIAARKKALAPEIIQGLSHRERNVFELIGQGLSTGAIAECLNIAISTVETYRERLKTKLNLPTGRELTRFAILWFAEH